MAHEGKYVVKISEKVDKTQLKTNCRIALKKSTFELVRVLSTSVDPLVSLMKVEKIPDSTYD